MSRSIKEARQLLTRDLARLIDKATEIGYLPAVDMVRRCDDCPTGHVRSLHKLGLAVDIILYDAAGNYITTGEAYEALGLWWEKQGADHAWGGRFTSGDNAGDSNHFSISWEGMR